MLTAEEKDAFVRSLLGFAHKLALEYLHKYRGRLPDREDLLEELRGAALLGLAKAAERFDPAKGFKPTTYAGPAIRWELLHAMAHHAGNGFNGLSNSRCRNIRIPEVGEFPEGNEAPAPETDLEEASRLRDVAALVREAPDQFGEVLRLRFLAGLTYRQMARRLNCSYEQARILEERALQAIRHRCLAAGLLDVDEIAPELRPEAEKAA